MFVIEGAHMYETGMVHLKLLAPEMTLSNDSVA